MFRTTIAVAVLSITAGAAFAEPPQTVLRSGTLNPVIANPALAGIKVFTSGSKTVKANPNVMPPRIRTDISRVPSAQFLQAVAAAKSASGPVTVTVQQPYWKDIAQLTVSVRGGQLETNALDNYIKWRGQSDPNRFASVNELFFTEPGHTYLIDTNISVQGFPCKITLTSPSQDELVTACPHDSAQHHILAVYKQEGENAGWQWLSMTIDEGSVARFWSFTVTRLD